MFQTWYAEGGVVAETAGGSITPYVVTVNNGEVVSDTYIILFKFHIYLSISVTPILSVNYQLGVLLSIIFRMWSARYQHFFKKVLEPFAYFLPPVLYQRPSFATLQMIPWDLRYKQSLMLCTLHVYQILSCCFLLSLDKTLAWLKHKKNSYGSSPSHIDHKAVNVPSHITITPWKQREFYVCNL